MQSETLAALGDSLRREFQEMLNLPLPSLAELTGDDLIDALDGQLQGLAAWLTSTALSVAPPPEAWDAPAEAEQRASGTWARPTSSEVEASSAAAQNRTPKPTASLQPTEAEVRASAMQRPLSAEQPPAQSGSEQARAMRQQMPTDAVERHPQNGAPSSSLDAPLIATLLVASPVASKDQIALPQQSERQPFAPALHSEAETQRDFEAQMSTTPRLSAEASSFGRFSVTKNLHDLARLLTSSDGHALDELGVEQTAHEADEAASPPVFAAVNQLDTAAFVEVPQQAAPQYHDEPPDQPSAVRVYEVQPPAGSAQPRVTEVYAPQPPPEPDMDTLLDALARSITEDYRRFYGS